MAPPKNKKNTRNSDSNLFKQLTKLLSGPLVKYRRQDTRQLKKRRLDKYKSRFRSASGQEFKVSASKDVYGAIQFDYYQNQNRIKPYFLPFILQIPKFQPFFLTLICSVSFRNILFFFCPT